MQTLGEHARYDHRLTVQPDRLTDHVAIALEAALPQACTDECYGWRARPIVLCAEHAASYRFDAQHRQQLVRYHETTDLLRLTAAGQRPTREVPDRDVLVQRARAQFDHVRRCDLVVDSTLCAAIVPEHDQSLGIAVIERLEQQRVDRAEDGRVQAHAECQGQNGNRREGGRARKAAQSVSQIGQQGEHEVSPDGVRIWLVNGRCVPGRCIAACPHAKTS